jgi:hypothetical protein
MSSPAAPAETSETSAAPAETSAAQRAGAGAGAGVDIPTWVCGVAMAILAAGLCVYMLSRPHMLLGQSEYDDAVYFGSAVRLVHGVIPYRNFVLVQPPGFQLLLAPFAFLSELIGTRDAFGAARLVLPLVAAAQVLLVWVILRHRGALAVTLAGAVVALHTAALSATHTLLLEPTMCFFCLAALAVAFNNGELRRDNRLIIAGLLIGFACAVKLMAVLAVLALAVVCLPRWRDIARLAVGSIAGLAVPVAPFVIIAPRQFLHEVIWSQYYRTFERVSHAHNSLWSRIPGRIAGMVGLTGYAGGGTGTTPPTWLTATVALSVVVFVAVAYLLRSRPFTRLDAAALAGVGLVGVTLVLSGDIYYHYYDLLVPYLALLIGCAASCYTAAWPRAASAWQKRRRSNDATSRPRRARIGLLTAAGLVVAVIALVTAGQLNWISQLRGGDASGAVDAAIPAGACVLDGGPAVLITSNRFESTKPGCPDIVDATGMELTYAVAGRGSLARTWLHAIKASDYLIMSQLESGRVPLTPAARQYIRRNFHPAVDAPKTHDGHPWPAIGVLVRNGFPR